MLASNAKFEVVWSLIRSPSGFPRWFRDRVGHAAVAEILQRLQALRDNWLRARNELCDTLQISPAQAGVAARGHWELMISDSPAGSLRLPNWVTIGKVSKMGRPLWAKSATPTGDSA
jgi:hypothetical protein